MVAACLVYRRTFAGVVAGVAAYNRAACLGLIVEGIAFGLFTRSRKVMMWISVCIVVVGVGLFALSKVGYQSSTVDPIDSWLRN